ACLCIFISRERIGQRNPIMECGGKRSATPLWILARGDNARSKAPSPLRSAGALQMTNQRRTT
ncbi:MAG: hypothetical protein ABR568_23260, partial [Pyrinomonadaceae bacterium]